MSKFSIADIEDQFINGKDTLLKGFHPIVLGDIEVDFSDLSPEGVVEFKDMIINIIVGSRKLRPSTKPDPIAAMLMNADRSSNEPRVNADEYARFEATRIADKWRGNRIGELNELICCLQPNMKKSDSGRLDIQVFDDSGKVIAVAEVKNRYNTMNAASAIRTRSTMETVVLDKHSNFHGCDAILVERIPKKNGEATGFNPSDPSRGQKTAESHQIKRMGLHQFLSEYGKAKHVYAKSIVLMAHTLHEQGILPDDYDLRFIFNLMRESLS